MLNLMTTGRLVADPSTSYTQDNRAITRFTIAVDRRYRTEETPADFHTCVAFGKTAEHIDKYYHKGMKIVLSGTLQNNNYTDKEGVKHYGENIIVDSCEFGESKNAQQTSAPSAHQTAPVSDTFMDIPEGLEDEGLPFL